MKYILMIGVTVFTMNAWANVPFQNTLLPKPTLTYEVHQQDTPATLVVITTEQGKQVSLKCDSDDNGTTHCLLVK